MYVQRVHHPSTSETSRVVFYFMYTAIQLYNDCLFLAKRRRYSLLHALQARQRRPLQRRSTLCTHSKVASNTLATKTSGKRLLLPASPSEAYPSQHPTIMDLPALLSVCNHREREQITQTYRPNVRKGPQVDPAGEARPPDLPPKTPLEVLPLEDSLARTLVVELGVPTAAARAASILSILWGRGKKRNRMGTRVIDGINLEKNRGYLSPSRRLVAAVLKLTLAQQL